MRRIIYLLNIPPLPPPFFSLIFGEKKEKKELA
jgi:hypothetical protein